MDSALLTLTKGLIDGMEPASLRAYLGKEASQNKGTLQMLEALVERVGGNPAIVKPFRDIQQLRSSGGAAHLAGSDVDKVLARTGIVGLSPHEALRPHPHLRLLKGVIVSSADAIGRVA